MASKPSIWGRYEDKQHAKLAMRQYLDRPDDPASKEQAPWYRVRFMPSEKHPRHPWAVCAFESQEEADACNEEGEVIASG